MPPPAPSSDAFEIAGWAQRLLRSRAGDVLLRKTGDQALLFPLERWFFPLSRLWAAANEAAGNVDRFRSAIGGEHGIGGRLTTGMAAGILRQHERARMRMLQVRGVWEEAAFAAGHAPAEEFARIEARRRQMATLHLASRSLFYPLLFPSRPPPARWAIPSPGEVESAWGRALAEPAAFFRNVAEAGDVETSPVIRRGAVREFWLRFPSPSSRLSQRAEQAHVYARVSEPVDGSARHTLIAGSGLCLETDLMWPAAFDASSVTGPGLRIVDIVSPYHGLRAWHDRYGGEPFFATAPLGTLDLVLGQTQESAALIGWCRERFGGKVAIGGISISSFVAQQVASQCGAWPLELRPDAVLLVSHTGQMAQATLGSALVRSIGLDRALARAGWNEDALLRWSPLLDPAPAPALPAERIVSALGTTDRVLPYHGGADLAQRWRLPPQNVFHFPIGHMVMPLALLRDNQPMRRLREILSTAQ